jgi:hypothetical protein
MSVDKWTDRWLERGKNWLCPVCYEIFDTKVYHCLHCDHHWEVPATSCRNCYNTSRKMPRAFKITVEEAKEIFNGQEKVRKEEIEKLKRPSVFYRDSNGFEPVKDWLEKNGWPRTDYNRSLDEYETNIPNCHLHWVSGHLKGGYVATIIVGIFPSLFISLHADFFKIPIDKNQEKEAVAVALKRLNEIKLSNYLQ